MAELAGLSIASNIAQFVVLGLQAGQYLYKAYNHSEEFLAEQNDCHLVARSVRNAAIAIATSADATTDTDLKQLAESAGDIAQRLDAKLKVLQRWASKDSFHAKIALAFSSLSNRSSLNELQARLVKLRDHITSELVLRSYQAKNSFLAGLGALSEKLTSGNDQASQSLDELCEKLKHLQKQLETGSATIQNLETTFLEAQKTIEHCRLRKRAENVLASLRFDDMLERKSTIPQAHQNTFEWALSEEKASLGDWLRNGQGIYWISGKAGSGKSTLMKYLQAEPRTDELLRDWVGDRPLLVLSHYFWAPGTQLQRSLTGLFRTLLFQIFLRDPELLKDVSPLRMEQAGHMHLEPWTFAELKKCFETLLSMESLPSKLCIFVDGLDEFEGEHGDLLEVLQAAARCQDVKLCVSSRPWVQFREAFDSLPGTLCVEHFTEGDIHHYIHDNLHESSRYRHLQSNHPEEARLLENELAQAANGVFLWVFLATRDVLRGVANHDDMQLLRKRLLDIPRDLEDYFMRMLHNIDRVYHYETSSLFMMLAYTQFPLNTQLTWAFRQSIATTTWFAEQKPSSLRFMTLLPYPSNLPEEWWAPLTGKAAYKKYNPQKEKTILTARCRDLIHISEEAIDLESGKPGFTVGFLHRTVADFLLLPKTKAILDGRLGQGHGEPFVPSAGLAHAYLELLLCEVSLLRTSPIKIRVSKRTKWDFNRLCLWILYLAKQTGLYSSSARERILIPFFSLIIGCPDITRNIGQGARARQTFESLVGSLGVDCFRQGFFMDHKHHGDFCREHAAVPTELQKLESLLWCAVCGDCLSESSTPETLISMLNVALWHRLEVDLTDGDQLHTSLALEPAFELAEEILMILKCESEEHHLDFLRLAWTSILKSMVYSYAASDDEWQHMDRTKSICQFMIRHGAPQQAGTIEIEPEWPLEIRKALRFPSGTNSVTLLEALGVHGIGSDFAQQVTKSNTMLPSEKVSQSWSKWIPWLSR